MLKCQQLLAFQHVLAGLIQHMRVRSRNVFIFQLNFIQHESFEARKVFIFQLKLHAQLSMKKCYNQYNMIRAFFLPDFVDSVKWCFIDLIVWVYALHPSQQFSVMQMFSLVELDAMRIVFCPADSGFWTYDLLITSQALYQVTNWASVIYC